MKFDFIEFINRSRSACRSKLEFAEQVQNELETVSEINDERTYMDRLIYKHQLDLTKLALKCGTPVNKGNYNTEITDLLDSLED